jgi:hypothetical protein
VRISVKEEEESNNEAKRQTQEVWFASPASYELSVFHLTDFTS